MFHEVVVVVFRHVLLQLEDVVIVSFTRAENFHVQILLPRDGSGQGYVSHERGFSEQTLIPNLCGSCLYVYKGKPPSGYQREKERINEGGDAGRTMEASKKDVE
jgi:hypothetical protein